MAEEKVITFAMGLRERIGSHIAGRELANTRIEACQDILRRDPGSRAALEPTIDIWLRIRGYHVRTIDECKKALADLGQPEQPLIPES